MNLEVFEVFDDVLRVIVYAWGYRRCSSGVEF